MNHLALKISKIEEEIRRTKGDIAAVVNFIQMETEC